MWPFCLFSSILSNLSHMHFEYMVLKVVTVKMSQIISFIRAIITKSMHSCFRQAQSKMCHSPKVENGFDNEFFSSLIYFCRQFWWRTAINPKPLERLTLFQFWELGLSISYHLTYSLMRLVLNCHKNWPYTLYGQDFLKIN